MITVSFQGERGAYSEAAARSFFKEQIETRPRPTFAEAVADAENGASDYAILPVENSIEGSVGESYDLLYLTRLNATGEIYHKIEHCLIGTGTINEADSVYSHPQALGQCRGFIQRHNMRTIPTYDTAGSVDIIKRKGMRNIACIASRAASTIYGVPVIAEDIADNPSNHTRFLMLSGTGAHATGTDKTSIIFSIKHEPGSLFRIIERFHGNGTNLTKIESRPTKGNTWEYNFYVDFEGHADDPDISSMLDGMKHDTTFLKVLGSYPSANPA